MTPNIFYISDLTNSSSFNGKVFRKKSMSENFHTNVLNLITYLLKKAIAHCKNVTGLGRVSYID